MVYDHDAESQYDIKVHKKRDWKLEVLTTYTITGFTYSGGIYTDNTTTQIVAFAVVVDAPNKSVIFSLTDGQTAGLTAGTGYYYDIKEKSDVGFDKQLVWGHVSIYDTGTP